MISPLTNTADLTCHIIRLVEQEETRDVREIFLDRQAVLATPISTVQVPPDYPYPRQPWQEVTADHPSPRRRARDSLRQHRLLPLRRRRAALAETYELGGQGQ